MRLAPDSTCVIAKPFTPGDTALGRSRVDGILERVAAMSESEVSRVWRETQRRFAGRHRDLASTLEASYQAISRRCPARPEVFDDRRRLVGAYFTHEYAIESAALTNPSMVLAPDQGGLAPGERRFVLSLRAIGEGHISSICFRTGVVDAAGGVTLDARDAPLRTGERRPAVFEKPRFAAKLSELGATGDAVAILLGGLAESFTFGELDGALRATEDENGARGDVIQACKTIRWLASSSYHSTFPHDSEISDRVLVPATPAESHGMEDARFVRFTQDDGTTTYFATYTAFDGSSVLPQLIETPDFIEFRIATLAGPSAKNKGIALFPRTIGGRYAALGRIDNERNFLMRSDDVRFWEESLPIQAPVRPWELVQLGNCGSPLETEAGWLVITHGVGPLRQYAIGAILLDRDDPVKVIGHLREPLLEPNEDERDGYVPNVVYSCGSMLAGDWLILPYGCSDVGTRIATVRLDDLLGALIGPA